jgi:hypothetical protein
MTVFAGTSEGVVPFGESAADAVDCGSVSLVRHLDPHGLFAATETGLYRSTDGGRSWSDLGVPTRDVYSVAAGAADDRLYAGTHGARLYASDDDGGTWTELADRADLPGSDEWETPPHHSEPRIRTVGTHPTDRNWLLLGIEVGGVYVSEDGGERWEPRRDGGHDDVHHVLVEDPSNYVVSTGTGLYRTTDGGRSWKRLDEAVPHRYLSESIAFEGSLYAGIARGPPGEWDSQEGADGLLLRFDGDRTEAERLSYPGGPEEVITAWTVEGESLFAGTNEGTLLERADDGFREVGSVGARIRSLASLPSEPLPRTD